MNSKSATRTERILRELRQAGAISVEQLCALLDVSVATVRRDLQELEERGLLRRTHGGAVSIEPLFYEPFRHDSSFQEQIGRHAEEKRRIALAAADMVQDGETIALTAGTTTTEVVRSIHNRRGVTVVTSTINVAMELTKRKDLDVFVTGGFLRGDWFSLVGPTAEQALSQVMITTAFIGADGIDAKWGASCFSPDEAHLNSVMVQQSRRRVAVVDHSKFGVVTAWRICQTSDLNVLVTDTGATAGTVEPFESAGVKVMRV